MRNPPFFLLILPSLLQSPAALSQTAPSELIQDVRVFDGEQVSEHRNVLIENGKIVKIGGRELQAPQAELIDGRGRTLLPSFVDAHVHIANHAQDAMRQALVLGVTTQLDMFNGGDRLELIKQIESKDAPDLADVRTAGVGATAPGGHPSQMGGPPFPTISGPEQAQSFVDARIAEGSDYIKIIHDDGSNWSWTTKRVPMLDNATMKALVDAAHKRGKLAIVHALSEQQARDAINAGEDGLAHMFTGDSISPDFGSFVASHRAFVIPTLSTIYWDCGESAGPAILADPRLASHIDEEWLGSIKIPKTDPTKNHLCKGTDEGIKQLVTAHAPILVGTDAPGPGTAYGASVHAELALLVRDGLTPIQALEAATSAPAHCFHLEDRGWIRPGMRADLLLVEGDPTTDILATRNIVAVWKRGVRVKRTEPKTHVARGTGSEFNLLRGAELATTGR